MSASPAELGPQVSGAVSKHRASGLPCGQGRAPSTAECGKLMPCIPFHQVLAHLPILILTLTLTLNTYTYTDTYTYTFMLMLMLMLMLALAFTLTLTLMLIFRAKFVSMTVSTPIRMFWNTTLEWLGEGR